jgi:hypothetical protein
MDPNELFFDNALDASQRLGDLAEFRQYVDGYLQGEAAFFRDEAHPDVEREFLPMFSATFPPILHSALVISSVMLVELELRQFANALREQLSLLLSLADLQGSLLERFQKYARLIAGVDLQFRDEQWSDVVGIFEIRNCLVHNFASLDGFGRRSVIEAFIKRNSLPIVDGSVLRVDFATSSKVLDIASEFFDSIYAAALHRFEGPRKWPRRLGT